MGVTDLRSELLISFTDVEPHVDTGIKKFGRINGEHRLQTNIYDETNLFWQVQLEVREVRETGSGAQAAKEDHFQCIWLLRLPTHLVI